MSKKKSNNWKKLQDFSKNKIKKKKIGIFFRFLSFVKIQLIWIFSVIFVIIGFLSIKFLGRFIDKHFKKVEITQKIKHISIKSDGSISTEAIKNFLDIPIEMPIMEIDLVKIRSKLESISCIKSIEIERVFPNTLKINILEHKPLLKLVINQDNFKKIWFVSEEGFVFKPIGKNFEHMPFLSGIKLKQKKSNDKNYDNFKDSLGFLPSKIRFEKLNSIEYIANFLKIAKLKYPNLYNNWKELSLEHFDNRRNAFWSNIVIKTFDEIQIIFGIHNFSEQLRRLDLILGKIEKNKKKYVSKIDLSLNSPVVEFKNK